MLIEQINDSFGSKFHRNAQLYQNSGSIIPCGYIIKLWKVSKQLTYRLHKVHSLGCDGRKNRLDRHKGFLPFSVSNAW